MQKTSKTVFISTIIALAVLVFILVSYPLLIVKVTETSVIFEEQWFENQRDIRYPVTVEKDWNHSEVYYEVIGNEGYIYWRVPVHESREVDFHFDAPEVTERYVFNETRFTLFQWGLMLDSVVEKDKYDRGTLSFVCNSSGDYYFVCKLNGSDLVPVRVSWVFSSMGEYITSYRVEKMYNLHVETRVVSKKVTFLEKLVLDYSKWSLFF